MTLEALDRLPSSPQSLGSVAVAGESLDKSFAGRKVLDHVNLTVRCGEIHALLGANGSGKSTLVKILSGVYRPDGGRITVGDAKFVAIPSPHEAIALGIAVVHQEAPLINTFTVAECIAQFRGYPVGGGRIRWKQLERETAEMLARFGVDVGPQTLAGRLSAAERALVAIIIALDQVKANLRLLVLDEVTASLPRNQAEPYLERVVEFAHSGIGVLMVTHRLAELHGRASTFTLLRDGRVVSTGTASCVTDAQLIVQMMGPNTGRNSASPPDANGMLKDLWRMRPPSGEMALSGNEAAALALKNVASGLLRDLSFSIGKGEIVGMVGLSEGGINELPRLLSGDGAQYTGSISINGQLLPRGISPRTIVRAGMTVLPADRLQSGGIATLSLAENAVLPDLWRYWRRRRTEVAVMKQMVKNFDIRPAAPDTLFGKLSGGNQQKTVLAKWLLMRPSILVLDDPTNGVDPGAREKIFTVLRQAAMEGLGILIFSTEPEQLANICSRVLVLRSGKVAHELSGRTLTHESISQWCYA
jgi:ABC-type sugar transport system ATPase subunit